MAEQQPVRWRLPQVSRKAKEAAPMASGGRASCLRASDLHRGCYLHRNSAEMGGPSGSLEMGPNVCLVPVTPDTLATLTGFLLSLHPSLASNLLAPRAEFKAVTGTQIAGLVK